MPEPDDIQAAEEAAREAGSADIPTARTPHRDDSEMSRFERNGQLVFRARDAVVAILICVGILLVAGGGAIDSAAEREERGLTRDVLVALGGPAGNLADSTPVADAVGDLTSGLSPDSELGEGGFDSADAAARGADAGVIGPAAFDSTELGLPAPPKRELETLLVTGDSLSTPLDIELSRKLGDTGVEVIRDPYLATGISREDLVDWGEIATAQVAEHEPDAVVVFIGANEGYPMTGPDGKTLDCCEIEWTVEYANRVRQLMETWRRDGAAKIYWVLVPRQRDEARLQIQTVVNAGIEAAAAPWRADVRIQPTDPTFTLDGSYTDAIEVDGDEQIVRESDGIHLNELGSEILADQVLELLGADWDY